MENHPIPQDVTGFQFKLVGNMTVKQFAYIAVGSVMALLLYYLPILLLIKFIFVPLFLGGGVALAFVPIEGRPLDMMLGNYFKDLFAPTQYIYQKTGGSLLLSTIDLSHLHATQATQTKNYHEEEKQAQERARKLNQLLKSVGNKPHSQLDAKEDAFIQAVTTGNFELKLPQMISHNEEKGNDIEKHQLSEDEVARAKLAQTPEALEDELEKEAAAIKKELQQARAQEQTLEEKHQATTTAHTEVVTLEQQLKDIEQQKQQLENELLSLKQQMEQPKAQPITHVQTPAAPAVNIHSIPTNQAKGIGLPAVPDSPNLIIGIVKDSRGNVLPNVLVEVKDISGNPVRAFKTNGLGLFASATTLANGTYNLEFEDTKGKHRFETVQLVATGAIILPLEVISMDDREELRRELFA